MKSYTSRGVPASPTGAFPRGVEAECIHKRDSTNHPLSNQYIALPAGPSQPLNQPSALGVKRTNITPYKHGQGPIQLADRIGQENFETAERSVNKRADLHQDIRPTITVYKNVERPRGHPSVPKHLGQVVQ